jgi:hypothetical protein
MSSFGGFRSQKSIGGLTGLLDNGSGPGSFAFSHVHDSPRSLWLPSRRRAVPAARFPGGG